MSSFNNIELSNDNKITRDSEEKLTPDEIKDIFDTYITSSEFNLLQQYDDYYEAENTFITSKVNDKTRRGKYPNNDVPTAYYSTVVDTMAGFMFANVQYNPRTITDTTYAERLNEILEDNNKDVKEMTVGTYSLAYNKGIELIYTTGDGETDFEIKYTPIDPRQGILIYNNNIEPDIFCMIWVRIAKSGPTPLYKIDVIYKDLWQYYEIDTKGKVVSVKDDKELFFNECPVVVYNTNQMSIRSPFHKIIKYINALDYLVTGNSNDIEGLTDAILVLSKVMKKEDLNHLDELRALFDVSKEDRAEFLTKEMDPSFREYVSKLLIREIHKHSHTVDYFSPDTGLSGEVSGKALRIRLFDMGSYSQKIEKLYRLGSEKKVRLLGYLIGLKEKIEGDINIVFNRTVPDEFEELAPVLNKLTFISDVTKLERLGFDAKEELKKLDEQKEANMERMELTDFSNNQENDDDLENDE